jgi:hypothetical protein
MGHEKSLVSMKFEPSRWTHPSIAAASKTFPIGNVVELNAGRGAIAHGIRISPLSVQEPERLISGLTAGFSTLNNPAIVTAIKQFTVGLRDFKTVAELQIGQPLPYSNVLDGFAILASAIEFWQAIGQQKGALKITLAGAQVAAGVADLIIGTTQTKCIMLGVDGLNKFVASCAAFNSALGSTSGTPPVGSVLRFFVAPMDELSESNISSSPAVSSQLPDYLPLAALFGDSLRSTEVGGRSPGQIVPDTILAAFRVELASMPTLAAVATTEPTASRSGSPRPKPSKKRNHRKPD